jgi:hypothetical protein
VGPSASGRPAGVKGAEQARGRRKALKGAICLSVAALLSILFCTSGICAVEEDSVELRVVKGDKLIHICRKYLEKPGRWREVARYNRMKNPDLIFPGDRVKIPVKLMAGVPVDGTITFLHGEVKVRKNEKVEWSTPSVGDRVSQGSRMTTGKASSAEITFEDRNSIFLKPNTTLGITRSEKRGASYRVNNFYLSTGRAITRLKKATGSDSRINIDTPSAIASVRGTEFRVSVDEAAAMRTEVLTGTVNVRAGEMMVRLNEGEGTYVKKGDAPVTARKLLPAPKPVDLKPLYNELPLAFRFEAAPGVSAYKGLLAKDRDGRNVVDEGVAVQGKPLEFINVPDGTYYLFAQGVDELGIEGFTSEPYEVKLRANPLPPMIQGQGDEAEFIGRSAPFRWLNVKDAVKYHLQVAGDAAFTAVIEEKSDHTAITYKTGTLDYGAYYFRISSIAADGYQAGWRTLPFRLVPPPPTPSMEKPKMGRNEIVLTWRDLGIGITYHFQMAKDPEFNEVIVDKRLDRPEITLQKPKDKGVYYVRTSSIDRKMREGEFSPSQTFEIRGRAYLAAIGGAIVVIGALFLIP